MWAAGSLVTRLERGSHMTDGKETHVRIEDDSGVSTAPGEAAIIVPLGSLTLELLPHALMKISEQAAKVQAPPDAAVSIRRPDQFRSDDAVSYLRTAGPVLEAEIRWLVDG